MKSQLLLLEDVDGLGRSGDLVSAKPGYIRNFLLPQKLAVIADKRTLKMQARLQEKRFKRAAADKQEAEELAKNLEGLVLTTEVKVDPEGRLYGSVAALDIARLMQEKGYQIERKNVILPQPFRKLGTFQVHLRLKEAVPANVSLEIVPEAGTFLFKKEEKKEIEKPKEDEA